MADTYEDFAELSDNEEEGEDYSIVVEDRQTAVAIIAPHAGKIERACSELTRAIAGDDLSFYLFEGIAGEKNSRLHITSTHFDEPQALALLASCDMAVAVHGRSDDGDTETVWVGGLDVEARRRITKFLKASGFDATSDIDDLAGESSDNICNRARSGAGVQIEVPLTLRQKLLDSRRLRSVFAAAVRETLPSGRAY